MCVQVASSWCSRIALTNGELAVEFKNGKWFRYPGTTMAHYNMMLAAPSKGQFVRYFLWFWPHLQIQDPCQGRVPQRIRLNCLGFANSVCMDCDVFNKNFICTFNELTQLWEGDDFTWGCYGGGVAFDVHYALPGSGGSEEGVVRATVVSGNGPLVNWTASDSNWNYTLKLLNLEAITPGYELMCNWPSSIAVGRVP